MDFWKPFFDIMIITEISGQDTDVSVKNPNLVWVSISRAILLEHDIWGEYVFSIYKKGMNVSEKLLFLKEIKNTTYPLTQR